MEHLSLKTPHAVLCKKWTVTVRTFLKNDGWEPAARFITYEFEQLVRLLFYPLVDGDRVRQSNGKFNLVFFCQRSSKHSQKSSDAMKT